LVVDDDGRQAFRGQSGPANVSATAPDVFLHSLGDAVSGCPPVAAAAGCFAGLLTARDRQQAEDHLRRLLPGAVVRAWPDYAAALAADPEADAIMICGTGSVVAWWQDGDIRKAGGGGPLLGDVGSAYWLGRNALSPAIFSGGRWSPNLTRHVGKRYGSLDPNEVIAGIYRRDSPAAEIALAAKVAVDDWTEGEPGADTLIDQHLVSILEQLAPVARKGARISLAGGFWNLSPRLLPRMIELDQEEGLNLIGGNDVRIEVLAIEPVQGAVNLARQLLSS
jgi:N-acetylglucosamine kinase-like BadF-type ATPase